MTNLSKTERAKQRAIKSLENAPKEKKCSKCKEIKLLEEFPKLKRGLYQKGPQCFKCKRILEKNYYDTNPNRRLKRQLDRRLSRYNLSDKEYEILLESQNYCCAICKIKLDNTSRHTSPHIDHCHESEKNGVIKVRGILCSQCNVGLGHFYDNEDSLLAAIQYLRK